MYFYILNLCLNTITSRINTDPFFDFTDFHSTSCSSLGHASHAGGGRWVEDCPSTCCICEYMLVVLVCVLVCVTSSTDHALKRHAWITVTVEFKRAMLFIFIFDVYKDEYDQDSPFPRCD
jgi:hypothetical protein